MQFTENTKIRDFITHFTIFNSKNSNNKNKNKTFYTIYNDYLERRLYYKKIKELLK